MCAILTRWVGVALLAVGLFPYAAAAQPEPDTTRILHLADLLARVQTTNPSLAAARLRAEALATRPEQVSALPQPTADWTYQPLPILTARGPQRSQWQVQQKFPFPGKRRLKGTIAALEAEEAHFDAAALARDLSLQVQQTYYTLYLAQQQARLVTDFQARLEQFEEVAATRYEVGEGPQQAILKAQIEQGRLDVRLQELQSTMQSARAQLARLTDQPIAELEGRAVAFPRALVDEGAMQVQRALGRRPEVASLRRNIEQAERQIALARKQYWPDFTVSAKYFDIADSEIPPSANGRDALAVSLGITVPLWRDQLAANVHESRLEKRRAQARLEALKLQIRAALEDFSGRLARQRRQLVLLDEQLLPQAEASLRATLSAYTTGTASFLDLLDAERTLLQLRLEYADTRARLLTTIAELDRAAGIPFESQNSP